MKRISVIIASGKGENSVTRTVIEDILALVQNKIDQIKVQYIYLNQINMTMCNECENCFNYGICPLDQKDDLYQIKDTLLQSDYIFWGTGVILHNVNPWMSILFERLAVWGHIFGLAGVGSTVVVTGSTNGFQHVIAYMKKILSFMGTSIGEVVALSYFDRMNEDIYRKSVVDEANKVVMVLNDKKQLNSNELQEAIFTKMKQYMEMGALSDYERQYWEENHLVEYDTFEQYVSKAKVRKSLP